MLVPESVVDEQPGRNALAHGVGGGQRASPGGVGEGGLAPLLSGKVVCLLKYLHSCQVLALWVFGCCV